MADKSVGVIGTGRMGSFHVVNVHRYVKGARDRNMGGRVSQTGVYGR